MAKVLRHILAVLCLLAAVFFLLPLGIGILHFGMVWPAALLLLCAAWLTWPDFFRRLLRPKWLRALAGCVIAVCMTAILVTLGKMAMAAADRPADGQDCTVVVLGCQVMPDGEPSILLRDRLDRALDYLEDHPDLTVVVSGGQGDNEPVTEARCMADYLMERGVEEDQLLLEERSHNTDQNLRYSRELLEAEGCDLSQGVVVVSNGFHLTRARMLAERAGYDSVSTLAAPSSHLPSRLHMYVREPLALVKSFFLDR